MKQHLKDKSYNQAMLDWAQNRSHFTKSTGGIFRPSSDLVGFPYLWGWFWRYGLVFFLAGLGFVFVMKKFGKSGVFANLMQTSVPQYFGEVRKAKGGAIRWDMDGSLQWKYLNIEAGDAQPFKYVEFDDLATNVPLKQFLNKQWPLKEVRCREVTLALKVGMHDGPPTPPEPPDPAAAKLKPVIDAINPGVAPDCAAMTVDKFTTQCLNLSWGSTPLTGGALRGAHLVATRSGENWELKGTGGTFRQSWLRGAGRLQAQEDKESKESKDGIMVNSFRATVTPSETTIHESSFDFKVRDGTQTQGTGTLTATITHGVKPVITGTITLSAVPLQQFLNMPAADYIRATVSGTITLSGTTNGSLAEDTSTTTSRTGINMAADLEISDGRLVDLAILRALEATTHETRYLLPDITKGKLRFTSSGNATHGGYTLETQSIEVECSDLLRLSGGMLFSRNPTEVEVDAIAATPYVDSQAGNIRLGIPARLWGILPSAAQSICFPEAADGWHWTTFKVKSGMPGASFADDLLQHGLKTK